MAVLDYSSGMGSARRAITATATALGISCTGIASVAAAVLTYVRLSPLTPGAQFRDMDLALWLFIIPILLAAVNVSLLALVAILRSGRRSMLILGFCLLASPLPFAVGSAIGIWIIRANHLVPGD